MTHPQQVVNDPSAAAGFFDLNNDFPSEQLPVLPKEEFGPADSRQCDRFHTSRASWPGRPDIPTVEIIAPTLTHHQDVPDDSDSEMEDDMEDSSDDEEETDRPRHQVQKTYASYAYWLQREVKECIYGSVYTGQLLQFDSVNQAWICTEKQVAIKALRWETVNRYDSTSPERPLQEIAALQHLQNFIANQEGQDISGDTVTLPFEEVMDRINLYTRNIEKYNVMTSLDILSDDTFLYVVMPFCDGGELFDLLLEKGQPYTAQEARFLIRKVMNGVNTLHKAKVCHRDMSLENIMLIKRNIPVIIDYGMCIGIPYTGNHRCLIKPAGNVGKPYYKSPEVVLNRDPFDGRAIDSFSLGPIFHMLVCGFQPWEEAMQTDEKFTYFSQGQFRPYLEHFANQGSAYADKLLQDPDLVDLLQRMFLLNPRSRLSLYQVWMHPWMRGPEQAP